MDKKKLVLIGPVYPYKGGISHYTGLLYRALSREYEVLMISYKMQYPRLLFKREQRDYSNDAFKVEGTEFLLNTANPFNIAAAAKRIISETPDAVLIEWWHPYFAPCYRILAKRFRRAGIRILFTCHNVFPHERFPMDKKLTRAVLSLGDGFILHSEKEAEELLSIKGDASYQVQVHPTYEAFAFEKLSKEEARKLLGIPEEQRVVLFFGFVREYKGLKHLLRAVSAFKEESEPDDFTLYVVGDFGSKETLSEYEALIGELGISSYINIISGYVPDREVEKYFSACDLVALPYESATQSGIVQIAYGFEKPVVATRVGGLPDVVTDEETGFLVKPCDEKELSEAISRFFADPALSERFRENIRKNNQRFSWERMVETVGRLL
ncbi:MAG: glycosyltransferase family 4 protein [Lachnospiraceae bacterium]|nr:glycosyltransferase family 4 protein [Lachnospiraceae bacterium]